MVSTYDGDPVAASTVLVPLFSGQAAFNGVAELPAMPNLWNTSLAIPGTYPGAGLGYRLPIDRIFRRKLRGLLLYNNAATLTIRWYLSTVAAPTPLAIVTQVITPLALNAAQRNFELELTVALSSSVPGGNPWWTMKTSFDNVVLPYQETAISQVNTSFGGANLEFADLVTFQWSVSNANDSLSIKTSEIVIQ